MTATLVLSGSNSAGTPSIAARVPTCADPVGKPQRPRRLRISEVRGAKHGDEDLCRPPLAGEAVDHHRHAVARVVDEQFVAGRVRLAHRHRQATLPSAVELAEARVPVSAGLGGNVSYAGKWVMTE
jgi:predicted secreted protein